MNIPQELVDDINQAILDGVQDWVAEVYDASQENVPVQTGTLKNSGSVRITSTGGEIAYNAPYAAAVEFGVESSVPFRGDQWIEIPMHRRRNGSIVKRHWRKYTDKRAFGFTPAGGAGDIVRVFTQNLKKIGQRFLGRAFEEKLTDLTESCEDEFRRIDGKTYKV